MEVPLDRAARKKSPLAAFWERPRKNSDAPHSDELASRFKGSPHHASTAPAAATAAPPISRPAGGSTFVGVQRLIQQYSASASASSHSSAGLATGAAETPKPLRRTRISGANGAGPDAPSGDAAASSSSSSQTSPLRSRSRVNEAGASKLSAEAAPTSPIATSAPTTTTAASSSSDIKPVGELKGVVEATSDRLPSIAPQPDDKVVSAVPTIVEPLESAEQDTDSSQRGKVGIADSVGTPQLPSGRDGPPLRPTLPLPLPTTAMTTAAVTDMELSASGSGSDSPYRTPSSSRMLPSASADSTISSGGHGSGHHDLQGQGSRFEPIIPRRSLSYDLGADSDRAVATRPRSATRTYLAADEEDPRGEQRRQLLTRADFGDDEAYLAYREAEKSRRMKKTLREQLKRRSKRRSGSVLGSEGAANYLAYVNSNSPQIDDTDDVSSARTQMKQHRPSHSASSSVSSQPSQRTSQRHQGGGRQSHGREIWIDSGSSSSSHDLDHDNDNAGRSRLSSPNSVAETFYEAELSGPSPTRVSPEASFLPHSSSHSSGSGGRERERGVAHSRKNTSDSKQRSLLLAEEAVQLDGPWLDLGSPTLHEPTSTSTLRQDAIWQERATNDTTPQVAVTTAHPESSPSSSSTATSTDMVASRWFTGSSVADSISTSDSSYTNSLPVSPTSGGFVCEPPAGAGAATMTMTISPSPSSSQISVPATGPSMTGGSPLRSHRTGAALPPPRPTPNAPLPPPPPGAPPPGRTSSRLRGYSTAVHSTSSMSLNPATASSIELDDSLNRNRSLSLGHGALTTAPPSPPILVPASSSRTGRSSAAPASSPASGSDRNPALSPPTTLGQMGRSMSSVATSMSSPNDHDRDNGSPLTMQQQQQQQAATLGPNGTIRGRPRGFTVGAVPASLGHGTYSASGRMLVPSKSRPRSLLCHEIVPGLDLAERRAPTAPPSELSALQFAASSSSPASLAGPGAGVARKLDSTSAASASVEASSLASANPAVGDSFSPAPSSSSPSSSPSHRNASERSDLGSALANANSGDDGMTDRRPSVGGRSRSGSSASLLQQVKLQPKSHASFVIAVVGHSQAGKSTVIKKGLRQFGLSKPHVLSEKVTSHSTACVVDQEQRTIEVLEIDASVLLNGPSKRFAWPKFLPHIDAVILCYDASQISSFRGMSELLENFALSNLSTVMLACKSEVHPKAVDPYYASDMASVYNVGLAECTVESEEGKKRMRDCFSYLVKEVAKARTGKNRRGASASTVPAQPATRYSQQLQQLQQQQFQQQQVQQQQQPSRSSQDNGDSLRTDHDASPRGLQQQQQQRDDLAAYPRRGSLSSSTRTRGNSGASSYLEPAPGGPGPGSLDASLERSSLEGPSSPSVLNRSSTSLAEWRSTPRKMSNATVSSNLSDAPSYTGSQEDDLALQESLVKARIGLQNARSAGGYVTIEELWDKLFHAAVSGNDERFRDMFMVFYRGFARPIDLLRQIVARFEVLAAGESSEVVMNRFALIRLTNMLGEWVQSYPGDLSHPETYALLTSFYARLQQHPSTTHTASLIRGAVEAAAYAPDIDAVWSKAVDNVSSSQQQLASAATTAAAATPDAVGEEAAKAASTTSAGASEGDLLLKPSSTSSIASGGASSNGASSTRQTPTPNAVDDVSSNGGRNPLSEGHLGRGGSESSLLSTPLDPFLLLDGRTRSASDVTTSSNEGGDSGSDGNTSASLRAFAAAANANSSFSTDGSNAGSAGTGTGTGTITTAAAASSSAVTPAHSAGGGSGGHAAPASPSASYMSAEAALRAISNTLMEVDDEVIAAEVTRLEWRLFTAIRPRDLLRHILVPRELRDGPVARSIAHFNYISAWVCSMILAQGKAKHRARMLEKFYNIASILRHDNNYGSLNSVLGGLSKTAVHRLKQTRELLKGKPVNKTHQSLVRLMSSERSNAAYRLALENSDGPTVPYVGVHLQDILSISDGNPSKRSDGLVHWRKFSLMNEAVMAIVRCQQYDRIVKTNAAVEKLVVDVPVMDDEALYERSLLVEPRAQPGQTMASSKINDLKSFLSHASSSSSHAAALTTSGGGGGGAGPD